MFIMNAFTLLKTDHKKVAGILEKLDSTTERGVKTREELFTQLKTELDVHTRIEETIFYPALEKEDETHDITLEAFEEHRLVKQLLGELESLGKGEEQWTAKFTVLKENIEHHVEEEEGEMFKKARKVLSEEDAEALGARMEKAKNEKMKAAAAS
jgi:hemerythrin-like domain-containing protein